MLVPVTSFSKGLKYTDYTVATLPKNAPKQIKNMLGTWEGYAVFSYYKKQFLSLTVLNINLKDKDALIKYSWGSYGSSNPGYVYEVGHIRKNSEIKFEKWDRRIKFIFNGNIINGSVVFSNNYIPFKMKKIKETGYRYKITMLQKNAPKQIKNLLGKWSGNWNINGLKRKAILIVKNINLKEKKALIMYAWGTYGNYNAGYEYTIGYLEKLPFPNQKTALSL